MERNERLSAISRENSVKATTDIQSLAINETEIQAKLMSKAIESQNIFIEEAGKKAEVVTEVIKKQGQTISLFTLITTIFLPLGFFCSVSSTATPPGERTRGCWLTNESFGYSTLR